MGESQLNSSSRQSGEEEEMEEPSREKLEEKITNVMGIIQNLEAELKCVASQSGDSAHNRLREMRTEKEATIAEMKKIEDDIQAHNKQIGLQRENLMKCQSNLHYKREDKINEAIKRLEYQLGTQNFRLTEEKKIIQEIDRLKKSKRSLSTYIELRTQLDKMRDQQNKMRDRRDALYRKKTALRTDEDEVRNKIAESAKRIEQLRKDIDDLYDQKRKMINDFRQTRKEYLNWQQSQVRKKNERKDWKCVNEKPIANSPVTKTKTVVVQPQERPMPRVRRESFVIEPYNDEITTCNILVKYLHRIGFSSTTADNTLTGKGCHTTAEDSQKPQETCFGMETRKKKKDKRFKKKYLVLTPDIFDKFDKIGLSPPMTYAEIQSSLEKIATKKEEYERLREDAAQDHSAQAGRCMKKMEIKNWGNVEEGTGSTQEDKFGQWVQKVQGLVSCSNHENFSSDETQKSPQTANVENVNTNGISALSIEYEHEKPDQTIVLVDDINCNLDLESKLLEATSIVSC